MRSFDIVIVGGGHGGAQAAAALRQQKFDGSIAIIGNEPELPYERPPLSKDYLSGVKTFERILIRPAAFWKDKQIAMLLGQAVVTVDPLAHTVVLAGGETVGYRKLIWATGGNPRRLACSGANLHGVHAVRTRADVDRLTQELREVSRVVVVGGGYIGLEAAAVLTKLGRHVTVIEALDRVLARVAGEPLSRFYENEHRSHGVDVRLGAMVKAIEARDSKACGVRLETDEVLPCEMIIVGIGIIPAVEPLIAAGADGSNGVSVDAFCRTSLPDIFAIGDCAAHENAFAGGARIRLESVQNATDQATIVSKVLTGAAQPYHTTPWFWSNQYDLRLQTAGLSTGHDETVVRGDIAARSFSILYLKDGRVIALDCVNAIRDYAQGRKLVESGVRIPLSRLADVSITLKDLAV